MVSKQKRGKSHKQSKNSKHSLHSIAVNEGLHVCVCMQSSNLHQNKSLQMFGEKSQL